MDSSSSNQSPVKTFDINSNLRVKDNEYIQSKKIIVKFSCPEMGLGVFATEDIEQDELVERCPLLQLAWRSQYHGDPQIKKYCFPLHCSCEDCQKNSNRLFLVLGYGSLYNHQDENNCKPIFNFQDLLADFTAIKPIKKGEEIFINYGENYFSGFRDKYTISKDTN